jgi:hypothetical protein
VAAARAAAATSTESEGSLVALPALPAPLPAGRGVGARVLAGPAHRRGEQVVNRLHCAQQLLKDAADDVLVVRGSRPTRCGLGRLRARALSGGTPLPAGAPALGHASSTAHSTAPHTSRKHLKQ